jgi:hypothetical protein
MQYALIPLMAFFYRCRGGFLPLPNTQLARLAFWAAPVSLIGLCISFPFGLICGATAFAGLLIPHARFQATASLHDCVGMALVGFTRLTLILLPLAFINPWLCVLMPIGLLQGGAEYIGWTFLNGRKISTFAQGGSEWQEILTGAVFGLALALAFVVR